MAFRPKTFGALVGQKKLIDMLQSLIKRDRLPSAFLFSGAPGLGKTTIARIISKSLQCEHQPFGSPCKECYKTSHDIIEVNAADVTGIDDMRSLTVGANFHPKEPSKYRVYILDELQKSSNSSQNFLLKLLEDSPKTTIWIICTTEPTKIILPLRGRCFQYPLKGLSVGGIKVLVESVIKFAGGSDRTSEVDTLCESLAENGFTSPRLVVWAVEKFLSGATPQEAALVSEELNLDTMNFCRAVVKGDVATVKKALSFISVDDIRVLKAALGGYLKSVVLGNDPNNALKACESIQTLAAASTYDDGLYLPCAVAAIYKVCKKWKG